MDSASLGLSVRALQRKRQAESAHPADVARRQAAKSQAKAKLLAETPEQREARLARYRVYYQARKRGKTEATATAAVGQQHEQQRDEPIDTSNGTHNTFRLAAGSTATARSHRDFTDNPLGSVGNMGERTRPANDLTAVCAGSTAGDSIGLKREVADTPPDTGGDSLDLLIPLSPLVHGQRGKNRSCAPDAALNGCSRSAAEELSLWTSGQHGCGKPGSRLESAQGGVHPVRLTMDAPSTPCNGNL
ncbi:uncharacterized protein [Dermacentor albipictus]